jgi:translocation and assembly module TamB
MVIALASLLAATGWILLRTDWFREQLRRRVAAELERATGSRVELAALQFDPSRWHLRLEGLRVRGTEPPGQPPLFQVDAVEIDLHIASFVRRDIDVAALRVVRPQIHVLVGPDGSTNFPERADPRGRVFTEPLLDLAVGRFEVQGGALWWNDQRYGLDGKMSDLRAHVGYSPQGAYDGSLSSGRVTVSSAGRLPPVERLQTRFRLLRDRIELSELAANTPHSSFRARGAATRLRHPRWEVAYEAIADARDLSAAPLREGRFRLEGEAEGEGSGWATRGKVSAEQLAVADGAYRLSGVAAAGDYAAGARGFQLDPLTVHVLGGRWKGRVSYQQDRLQAEGRVEGLRFEEAAAALSTGARPLRELGWTGVVQGSTKIQTRWPASARTVSLEADLTLGEGRATGAARASYRGPQGELDLAELRLVTPDTNLAASGRITRRADTAIRFHLRTARLEELTRVAFAATGRKIESPIRLEAPAGVQGSLSGAIERPRVSATLETGPFLHQDRRWDAFRGQVEWSYEQVRLTAGRLVKGRAVISVSGSARLQEGAWTEQSPIEAEVGVRDTQMEDLLVLAGASLPATGAVTAQFRLKGTQQEPRGAGSLELRRGTLWQEPFDSLRTTLLLEGREVRASNLRVVKGKGVLSGNGAYHTERRTFRFDARGERLWSSRAPWEGTAAFAFAGSGRLGADGSVQALTADGAAQLQDLSIEGRKLGTVTATARATAEKLHLELLSSAFGSKFTGKAEVGVHSPFPLSGNVEFQGLDLAQALAAAEVRENRVTGVADGSFTFAGQARNLEGATAQGRVTRLELNLPAGDPQRPRSLKSAAPLTWRLAGRKFTLDDARLTGEGTDLRASGTVGLGKDWPLQIAVSGSLNLAVLSTVRTGLEVTGLSALNVSVGGTAREPNLSGRLDIREAGFASEELPLGLSRVNGIITFSRRRATIQKMTAEAGGGEVTFTGDAEIGAGLVSYRLRTQARNVRLRYPRGLSSLLDATLTLAGANQRSRLEGHIEITRAGTRSSVDLASLIAALKEPPRTPSANEWLQGTQLNVTIESSPDVRYDTALARNLQADVAMRLRGTLLNPALLGRMNITQGEVEFQGTRYTLNRGEISFSNPFRIEPVLNLDLETRVSGYDILLTLIGPLQKINVTYRSDPPLTFNELVTLLAVGRAPTIDPTLVAQQTSQARAMTQIGADALIGQAITSPVTGRLQRFFGVSRLKLDPDVLGAEGNATARVTLEQQVGRDVTFTYTYNLASAQEQIIRVRWSINREWSLEAIRDQNGLVGLDVLYKKRFR